jgi:membrane-associated phospholipid phosphatase
MQPPFPRTRALPHRRRLRLPRGRRDLLVQLAVWLGFVAAYELVRGIADRGPDVALENARRVLGLQSALGAVVEPDVQDAVLGVGDVLVRPLNWTYWLSQFAVLSVALVVLYVRYRSVYGRVRDALIATNTIALIVYLAMPTAPPRLVPELGLVDTLAASEVLNHGSGLVEFLANPYAAMPSVHAADALILGIGLALVARSALVRAAILLWPVWVAFALLATGNHFWLDVAAGAVTAGLGLGVVYGLRRAAAARAVPRVRPGRLEPGRPREG